MINYKIFAIYSEMYNLILKRCRYRNASFQVIYGFLTDCSKKCFSWILKSTQHFDISLDLQTR